MADAVIGVLSEKLLTFIQDETQYVREFTTQLTKMKDKLLAIQSCLEDAELVKKKEDIKTISQNLRELLYDTQDIIANCELMFIKQQQRTTSKCLMRCSLCFLIFRCQIRKKLDQINQCIESLREKIKSFLESPTQPKQERRRPVRYPVLVKEDQAVKVKDNWDKTKGWVTERDGPLKVIGFVGTEGIIITTLAQKIFNDEEVRKHFDCILMVVVSQTFKLIEIVTEILRTLGVNEVLLTINESKLFQLLSGQLTGNFLLILDGEWTISEEESSLLKNLQSNLPQRNDGSCIIVTTRYEKVARSMGAADDTIHYVEFLSEEDSWSLFCKITFVREGGRCPNSDLEGISKEIVGRCSGFPLVIKVVAGIMLGKEPSSLEWKKTSEQLKEELAANQKEGLVTSILRLSYEELPMHLKPCMLCFAAFSENSDIYFEELIYWWIGEGFVRARDEKTAYEIGEECWNELISRGLLQGIGMDYFEKSFETCRVHYMVRDMIVEIAKGENFMGLDDKGNPSLNIQSRRVCMMKTTTDRLFTSEENAKSLRLRTLFWRKFQESEFLPKLIQFKWLRVFDVMINENYKEKDEWWSNGIGSLPHLVYLKIENSNLNTLPDSIGNLRNLQVLCLCGFSNLITLPVQITTMVKLTVLYIWCCDSLEYYPEGIGKLPNLQYLGSFKPSLPRYVEGCSFTELKNMIQLELLGIEIDSEDRIAQKELQVLSQLEQLKTLAIDFKRSKSSEVKAQLSRKFTDDIKPCRKLEELHIWNFPGDVTPAWLNPTTLPNLQFLRIFRGNMTSMHRQFFGKSQWDNWILEALILSSCENLDEEWQRMERSMPFLRLLKVDKCPKLKKFPGNAEGEGTVWKNEDKAMNRRRDESNSLFTFLHRIIS